MKITKEKFKPYTLNLDEVASEKNRKYAKEEGRSLSNFVRELMKKEIKRREG